MMKLFDIDYIFESEYYNVKSIKYNKDGRVRLKKGEYHCSECTGIGFYEDDICIKCFGCGKLDWLENVLGQKNSENINESIIISTELRNLESDIKRSIQVSYEQTSHLEIHDFFQTLISLFTYYQDSNSIKGYTSSVVYFDKTVQCESIDIIYMPKLSLEKHLNRNLPVKVKLTVSIY